MMCDYDNNYMKLDAHNNMIAYSGIKMAHTYTPTNKHDVTTKKYVDELINDNVISISDATNVKKGIIKLSGDLTGSADNPIVANNSINKNKLSNFDNPNILLGSDNLNKPIEYALGNNISTVGSTLQLVNVVKSINGINPDKNGNIIISNDTSSDATNTSKGVIKLSGDLDGTADNPIIGTNKITKDKLAKSDDPNILLGSDNLNNITEYTIGNNLNIVDNKLNIINVVKTVNGILPDKNGNVPISLTQTFSGKLSNLPTPDVSRNGDVYIVVNDPSPTNNGRMFIFTLSDNWCEVTINLAITDSRYVKLVGTNLMSPNSKITMSSDYIPLSDHDLVTKKYIDSKFEDLHKR
jgi:hypothetical protein